MSRVSTPTHPFGVMLTAMVSPFTDDGALDVNGIGELATYLVDTLGHDGLIVNGTTGEAPTTTDAEKETMIRATVEAVGDRAHVVAGVSTYDTAHSIHLARQAEAAGAHGVLAVTPYYNRPPQEGVLKHFWAIADATGLPMITYDIPKRTGTPIETDTLVALAEHPRVVANKDAKGDLESAVWGMRRTGLAWYCGDDALNLPMLALGAAGFISVVGHLVGDRIKAMAETYANGDVGAAAEMHSDLMPVYTGCFRTQGVILTKAALNILGLPAGPVRLPLIDATPAQVEQLRHDLAEGHVRGFVSG